MLSSAAGAYRPPQEDAYSEDLPALAALEFRLAQTLCGECRSYHGLFGYGRIAGANRGLVTDKAIIAALLSEHARPSSDVLIAGAADTGLLALTARTLHVQRPKITVADSCATPLTLCEHFASAHGLDIETIKCDLTKTRLNGPFNIVLAHFVLNYVSVGLRPAFFASLRACLGEHGKLVLVCRGQKPSTRTNGPGRKFSGIAAILAAKGIPLPEPEAVFSRRAESLDGFQFARDTKKASLEEIGVLFADANLRVNERLDYYRHYDSAGAVSGSVSHFFVASPAA